MLKTLEFLVKTKIHQTFTFYEIVIGIWVINMKYTTCF